MEFFDGMSGIMFIDLKIIGEDMEIVNLAIRCKVYIMFMYRTEFYKVLINFLWDVTFKFRVHELS